MRWPHALTGIAVAAAALLLSSTTSAASTVVGVDVSHYNGPVNWLDVTGSGRSFVFAKATEGPTLTDATYVLNRSGASGVGLTFGAYHFARPTGVGDAGITSSAIAQADRFVNFAHPGADDLPPVLDLEKDGGLSHSALIEWTRAWLDEVDARLGGVKPIIYTGLNFWRSQLADTSAFAIAGYKLWYARYTTAPNPAAPANNWARLGWTFWQWTSCAHVPGLNGCTDADRFRGVDLGPLTIPVTATGPPSVSAPPAIVGAPRSGRPLAAVPGLWTGTEPIAFTYQWQRCDAAGHSCTPIATATKETYRPRAADAGRALSVRIRASNESGAAVAVSPPTVAIAASGPASGSRPSASRPPTISGTAQAGQTLTATAGLWAGSPTRYVYHWQRCAGAGSCVAIPGANTLRYTPLAGDIASTLRVRVTARNQAGATTIGSQPTRPVSAAPLPRPAIGSAVAIAHQAGVVTTGDGLISVEWQPGAVAVNTLVSLAPAASRLARLALPGRATTLSLRQSSEGGSTTVRFPVDIIFAAPPPRPLAAVSPDEAVWRTVPRAASPVLATGQADASYADQQGNVHVLTMCTGAFGLLRTGGWGDPRFTRAARPRLRRTDGRRTALRILRVPGGGVVRAPLHVDEQARLSVRVLDPLARTVLVDPQESAFGSPLSGTPTRNLQALVLTPRVSTLRLRLLGTSLTPGPYVLGIVAVDPYGRRAVLQLPLRLR